MISAVSYAQVTPQSALQKQQSTKHTAKDVSFGAVYLDAFSAYRFGKIGKYGGIALAAASVGGLAKGLWDSFFSKNPYVNPTILSVVSIGLLLLGCYVSRKGNIMRRNASIDIFGCDLSELR